MNRLRLSAALEIVGQELYLATSSRQIEHEVRHTETAQAAA